MKNPAVALRALLARVITPLMFLPRWVRVAAVPAILLIVVIFGKPRQAHSAAQSLQSEFVTLSAWLDDPPSPICPGDRLLIRVNVETMERIPQRTGESTAVYLRDPWRAGQKITVDQPSHGVLFPAGKRGQYTGRKPHPTQAGIRVLEALFRYTAYEPGLESLLFSTTVETATGRVMTDDTTLDFEVEHCQLNTAVILQGYYQGEGYALAWAGWMDEVELTPVDEQHYAGSGTFYMNTIHMFPGCSFSHTPYEVETTITAVSSEETLALTFESEVGEVVLSVECGGGSFSAPQPPASLADFGLGQVTLPPEGGVVNVPDSSSAGTFTIIVTWEAEEEAIPVSDAGGPTGRLPAWLILADTSQ